MKIAYVHDWLVFPWGAEQVFFDIIKATSNKPKIEFYNKQWQEFIKDMGKKWIYNQKNEYKIFTAFHKSGFTNPTNIEIESVLSWKNIDKYFRNLMPFFPIITKLLSQKIKKYNPDLIIISSFSIAKNINVNKPKILYLHSIMQYIWTLYEDYLNKFSGIKKHIFKFSSKYLRNYDKKYTKFEKIYFNSNYTKKEFEKMYNKKVEWKILFPIVEKPNYKNIDIENKFNIKWGYYIYIWRLVKFVKNLDIIIDAFNKNWKQLIIVWDGPDKEYLKSIAKDNIKFLWYINNKSDEYWNLLEKAKALVNITKESFWIVNYQAYLVNTPIISINWWAINEIPWKKTLIDNFENLWKVI